MDFKDNRVSLLRRSKNRISRGPRLWLGATISAMPRSCQITMFPPRPITVLAILAFRECRKYKTNIFPLIWLHLSPPPPPVETDFYIDGLEGTCPQKLLKKRWLTIVVLCARIQEIPTYSLYGKQIPKVVFCGTIHYNLKARLHLDKNLLQKSLLLTNQCWPCVHEAQIARRPRRAVPSFSFFAFMTLKWQLWKRQKEEWVCKIISFFNSCSGMILYFNSRLESLESQIRRWTPYIAEYLVHLGTMICYRCWPLRINKSGQGQWQDRACASYT